MSDKFKVGDFVFNKHKGVETVGYIHAISKSHYHVYRILRNFFDSRQQWNKSYCIAITENHEPMVKKLKKELTDREIAYYNPDQLCNCDIHLLCNRGCQCGAIKNEI